MAKRKKTEWRQGSCINYRFYVTKDTIMVADIEPDKSIIEKGGMNALTRVEISKIIADLSEILIEMGV